MPAGIVFHSGDIRSPAIAPFFEGVDVVFHLAAKNSLYDCQKDPVGTMEMNVVGTANIFDIARKAGVRKVVYAQSSIVEEGEARSKGFYAISKLTAEMLAAGFEELGLTTVGLRYFNVYGPGQDYRRTIPPIMSRLIMMLLRGERPVVFDGDEFNKRDFVYVDDLTDFHQLCVEDSRVDHRMFRLGSGVSYSMEEVLAAIQDVLGTNLAPIRKPRMSGDPPVETKADISASRALGWIPKTSLRDGIRAMAGYIQEEMAKGTISA